jgi:adhesin transport system outer membrane protein
MATKHEDGRGGALPAVRKRLRGTVALTLLLCGPAWLGMAPAQVPAPAPPVAAPITLAGTSAAPLTLREAAQLAVLNNPEVLARWHTVRAAQGERDAARGGLLPRADLSIGSGRERRSDVTGGSYNRTNGSATLTQLLFDGFATRDEVRRLDHTTRVRVFELISTSEGIALEAARAYLDVARYRELVALAEENFVEHRAVFAQTDQRVKAKVARAVDLEQITGRLALAEANLLIETSNLHDTTARFQRLVGRLPPRAMAVPPRLEQGLPTDATAALVETNRGNAAVLAAIEGVRAADAALDVRKAAYAPRLDFRLRRDQGRNFEGTPGPFNASVAELVLNWNLFNGFSDRARERQFAEQLNVARDTRDKTCLDTRQTTAIAFNDTVKLREQLQYLAIHESSLTKALAAYRLQFQIGQRSLLDLLDTENERFQARRAVVNARYDLSTAFVRTQAGIGNLLRALDLSTTPTEADADLRNWNAGTDAAQQCPAEAVTVYTADKDALVQRAMQQVLRGAPAVQEPSRPAEAAPAPAAAPVAAPLPGTEVQVRAALEAWRAAWASRDVAAYLASYAPAFAPPPGTSRAAWEKRRRAALARAAEVSIDLGQPQVVLTGPDQATTVFTQSYRSARYRDRVRKTMEWRRIDGRWLVVAETSERLR